MAGSAHALLFLGLFALAQGIPGDAIVSSLFPLAGSMQGGTELTILGAGFERSNVSGQTLVYIGNNLCSVIYYKSSDSKLLCITPPYPIRDASLLVRVVLLSTQEANFAKCPGNNCFFRYRPDNTPVVQRLARATGSYELLGFDGYLRGLSASQYEVKINNYHCVVDDAETLAAQWGTYVQTNCSMPLLPAGVYNVSIAVQDSSVGAGLAQKPPTLAIGTSLPYDFVVYPVVNSLSTQVSGSNGGQTLVITGSGFDTSNCSQNNNIAVRGVPCIVISCTQTTLSCTIGPAPAGLQPAGPFASSRGLLHKIYYNLYEAYDIATFLTHPRVPSDPNITRVNGEGLTGFGINIAANYGQMMEGYFVPKQTTLHLFYISSDDGSDLFMSFNNSAANLTRIAYAAKYSANYWVSTSTQVSKPLLLQAGVPYMIRARHTQGHGGDFFNVAVRVVNPAPRSPLEVIKHSVHERQTVAITSAVQREVQTLNFTAPVNSSVFGQFVLKVTSSGITKFSASLNISTSSGSAIASAVGSIMPGCNNIGVTRRVATRFQAVSYEIIINCPTVAPYPRLSVDNTGQVLPLNMLPVWERTRNASAPVRGTFMLAFNNSWTEPISWNDNGWTVASRLAAIGVSAVVENSRDPNDGISHYVDIALPLGDLPLMQINTSGLTGDGVQGNIYLIENGSMDAFYDPIPADYFAFPTTDVPNVVVTTNGITATCADPSTNSSLCGLRYVAAATPQVTAISTTSPTNVLVGDVFSISGSGFGTVNDSVVVRMGQGFCTVTALSDTAISCIAGDAPQGSFSIAVLRTDVGLATVDGSEPNNFTYGYRVDTFTPLSGAPQGGNTLTIRGTGFGPAAGLGVTVGGRACTIVSASFHTVTCVVPAVRDLSTTWSTSGNNTAAQVNIGQFGQSAGASYLYDWALQSIVTDVQPRVFSAGVTTMITLDGDFSLNSIQDNSSSCVPRVFFGTHECVNLDISVAETQIICAMIRGNVQPIGQQLIRPRVLLCGADGRIIVSHPEPGVSAEVALRVTNLSTHTGSIAGSTQILITGVGFVSSRRNRISIMIISSTNASDEASTEIPCGVSYSTFTEVLCNISALSNSPQASLTGFLRVLVNNVEAPCIDCGFSISSSSTPTVSSMWPLAGWAGDVFSVNGTQLTNDTHVMIGPFYCSPLSFEEMVVYEYSNDTGNSTSITTANITTFNELNSTNITVLEVYTVFTCLIPPMPAGSYRIRVHVDMQGDTLHTNGCPTHYTSLLRLDSISPQLGGLGGGLEVTIRGAGFSPANLDNWLTFGSLLMNAFIVSSNYSTIVAVTPFQPTSVNVNTTAVLSLTVQNPNYGNRTNVQGSSSCANPALCTFTYTPQLTINVLGVSPTSGTAGTLLRITGNGFGTNLTAGTVVEINNVPCVINTSGYTSTQLFCRLGNSPAGPSLVYLTIPGRGTARTTITFTPQVAVTSFTPTSGGFGGGQTVEVFGSGFGYEAAGSQVFMCGKMCDVKESSYNRISCVTSDIATNESVYAFNVYDSINLPGTSSQRSAFDNDYGTLQSSCPITYDLGATTNALLTKIGYFPPTTNFAAMNGGWFETSANNVNWTVVGTIREVRAGWNSMSVSTPSPVRYVRYRTRGTCVVAEIEIIGIPVQVTEPTAAGSACRVNVSVNVVSPHPCHGWLPNPPVSTVMATDDHNMGGMAVMGMMPGMSMMFEPSTTTTVVPVVAASTITPANLTFLLTQAQTPIVQSVSPRWGTALGGTEVTVRGFGLPTVLNQTTALLNGVPCSVTAVSTDGSWVRCVTGAKTDLRASLMLVGRTGSDGSPAGYCMCNTTVRFDYLDRWSDLTTWSDEELPVDGDTVIIPEDQRVLLDVSPPRLFVLLVQGTLVFDRKDLALNASYIFVAGGKMQVGTEEEPFLQKATITLHGDRMKSIELPHIGSKVLAVSNKNPLKEHAATASEEVGMLDIHGAPRLRTWTKVAADAVAGSTTIVTAEDVDFAVGDQIVLTSGASMSEIEELVVAGLGPDRRTLTVTTPLQHTHESRWVDVGGRRVDMRCEVGLLTRNVVIQGEDGSEAEMFGVHTIAVHGGIYRIENTEVRKCGQAFNLGRYCVHYHMAGEERHCYARSNSIHHSFQRAIVIHGTNNLRVQHNFAYHVMGHTFFVEDGAERYNYIEENLGAKTLQSFSLLKSDTKPATFWTSSPTNYWRHNVAAGCTHDGFWLELPRNPGGPSFITSICPFGERLGEFYNNTAHSNGVHGLRVYPVYLPHQDPCNASSPSAPQYFYNFTSYHNGGNGIFGKMNGDLHHINANLLENGDDDLFWKKFEEVDYSWDANIKNVLFVGSLTGQANWKHAFTCPQNEFFYVSGAIIVNYGSSGAIAGCAKCDSDQFMKQGGYTVRFDSLEFSNSPVRTFWNEPKKDIFIDLDGTLTGQANSTVTPFYGFNAVPECPRAGAIFSNGLVCNSSVQVRRLQIASVEPRELDFQVLRLANPSASSGTIRFRPKESYGWVAPVVTSYVLKASFISLVDWQRMRIRYSEPEYVQPGEWMQLSFNYTDYRYSFAVTYADTTTAIASFPDQTYTLMPTQRWGTSLINPLNQSFDVILATGSGVDLTRPRLPGPYSLQVRPIQCAPNNPTCGFTGDVALQYPPLLWSAASTWPNNKRPVAGDDVVIPAGKIIQMDVNPPKLKNLVIYGKLQFVDNAARWLQVDSILVFGYLEVGLSAAPFQNLARISVSGIRTSPTVIVNNDLFLGNKVIANLGRIDMVGKTRVTPWTKLATTVVAGDRTLRLAAPCDWVAGDAIAITPTEYGAAQTENLTVAAVSADGLTVNVTTPLRFRHFAGLVADGRGGMVQLAAAVGVLTRNIVVEGVLSGPTDVYGAHMIVADAIFRTDKTVRKQGSVFLSGVEFRNTGKQAMQYASVAFMFSSLPADSATWPENVINGSSFSHSLNYGVVSMGSGGVNITNNVFHRTFRTAVDLDEDTVGMTMQGNLIVGNYRSPDDPFDWVRPFAGFFVNTRNVRVLKDNVVGGTDDSGFVFYPEACGASNPAIANNEVHGALVGFFAMSAPGLACGQVIDALAWKCGHIGVLTVDQTAMMRLNNVTVSDNHMGISLNYIRGGQTGRSDIVNSRIFGSTAASTCSGSLTCRAVAKVDVYGLTCQSVFGSSVRRVGLVTDQYLNRPKTCKMDGGLEVCRPPTTPERLCSLPWEKRYGLPTTDVHAETYVTDTAFGYFQPTDCGATSVGVALNPSQIDYTPHLFFSGITWTATNESARLQLGLTAQHPSECQTSCDSTNYALANDVDGSLFSNGAGTLMSTANPLLAYGFPTCTSYNEVGSIFCPNVSVAHAMLINNDLDLGSRKFGPVRATKFNVAENRTVWSKGPFDDSCAMRFFFGQYPFALEAGQTYFIYTTGTMPSNARLQYFSKLSSDVVLLRIFYTKPYSISIFNGGAQIPALTNAYPTLASPRGANAFDAQQRLLYLTLRGSAIVSQQIYNLRTESNVQLSLSLKIAEVDFFGPTLVNNLATLLQIPASRIKIVAVHALGTRRRLMQSSNSSSNTTSSNSDGINVNVEISPPQTTAAVASNTTALQENIVAQQTLMNQVASISSSGALSQSLAASGIPLASMSITPPPGVGAGSSSTFAVPIAPTSSSSESGQIVYIGVGSAVGAVGFVVLLLVWAKRQKVMGFGQRSSATIGANSPTLTSPTYAANKPDTPIRIVIPEGIYDNTQPVSSEAPYDNVSTRNSVDAMQLSVSTSELSAGQPAPTTATSPPTLPWSRPDLNRDAAHRLILNQPAGTFVIYGKGSSALAVRTSDSIMHVTMQRLDKALPRYRLAVDESQPWFNDIESLVKYYKTPRAALGGVGLADMAVRAFPSPRLSHNGRVPSPRGGSRSDVLAAGNVTVERRESPRTVEALENFQPTLLEEHHL